MEKNDGKETLNSLKKETCQLIDENNAICRRISEIELSSGKLKNNDLMTEMKAMALKADRYFNKIQENYKSIVKLEEQINHRRVDPDSPSMLAILHEWENSQSSTQNSKK